MSGRFWANVMSVLSGAAIAQAIPIIGSLFLARLYSTADFGSYSVWVGAVLIMAVVSTLRLEMALAVVDDGTSRREAMGLVVLTIAVVGTAAAIIANILLIAGFLPDDSKHYLLGATALAAALLSATSDSWQAWAAAEGRYTALTTIRVTQAFAIVGLQIGSAFFFRTVEALAISHLCGLAAAILVASRLLPIGRIEFAEIGGRLARFWKEQSRFPMFALPADSINSLTAQMPLIVVSSRFGPEAAGLLALTMRVLGAPIALLGRSVLDVFRRHAASAYRERGECAREYGETFRVLSAASLALIFSVALLGPPAFALVFGEKWRMSGTIAMWLVPLFAFRFVASPLSYVFYIAGKQNVDLVWQSTLIIAVSASLWLPPTFQASMWAYSVGYSAMYVVYLGISYRYSKGR